MLIEKGSTLWIEMFKSTFNDLGDNPGKPLNYLFYSLNYFEEYYILYKFTKLWYSHSHGSLDFR